MLHCVALTMMLAAALQAPAQTTSRARVRTDPRAHYAMLKELYQQAYAATAVRIDPGGIDLIDCGYDPPAVAINAALDNYNEAVSPLAHAAYDIVHLRAVLTAAGYPERVWGPRLAQFESQQLALVIDDVRTFVPREQGGGGDDRASENARRFYDRMAATLNAYRRSSGANLPPVTDEGGCGAGEVGIQIKTVPANAFVLFIPKFFYQLCQKQGVDPTDVRRCDWWREAQDGMIMGFAGDYLYRARWPDGSTRDGRLSFNHPQDDQTFVIRKP